MTTYFTALDTELNFPSEIRDQLAKCPELKHMIVPMSQATRNNLRPPYIWDGRAIYNTSKDAIEVWHDNLGVWIRYFDDKTDATQPVKPWDHENNLPIEVRQQLVTYDPFKNVVTPMTSAQRQALSPSERWDGRVIFNRGTKQLEVWKSSENKWVIQWDHQYSIKSPPLELQRSSLTTDHVTTSLGPMPCTILGHNSYARVDDKINYYFRFEGYQSIANPIFTGGTIRIALPVNGKVNGLVHIGSAIYVEGYDSNFNLSIVRPLIVLKNSGENFITLEYFGPAGTSMSMPLEDSLFKGRPVTDIHPQQFTTAYPLIYGNIVYEAA